MLTQHQDCQSTVIEAAKAAKAYVVGYHYDARGARPERMADRIGMELGATVREHHQDSAQAGNFTGSQYNANFIGTFASGDNPLKLAPFGPRCLEATQSQDPGRGGKAEDRWASIFKGPIYCNNGKVLVPAGKTATPAADQPVHLLRQGSRGLLVTSELHECPRVGRSPCDALPVALPRPLPSAAERVGGLSRSAMAARWSGCGPGRHQPWGIGHADAGGRRARSSQ